LNRSVLPAEDEVTSATGFDPAAAGEHAGAAFTTTSAKVARALPQTFLPCPPKFSEGKG